MKINLGYYFLSASGALVTLAVMSALLGLWTGDITLFWIALVGFMVHQARLENPTVVMLSEAPNIKVQESE